MYRFLHGELDKMGIPARRIRFEVFGQAKDITQFAGYPEGMADKTFELTVVRGIHEDRIPAKATESIVVALERAGIRIETGCRSGECGFCRSKLLSGNVFICPENDGRRAADKDFGYIHACAAYPLSDCRVRIPIE
ncbi:MAG: 2Fe-2S iron-sulfur cluster binding domain-containing protein [Firmicutes bacterium]|nr:2Fe-2S iron-sulfur cluster binding domain-containing protein [Bacillota bacterium]